MCRAEQGRPGLLPASLWYDGPRLRIHPEIVPGRDAATRVRAAAMTQELADVFTDAVRRHPQDWHVLQPVWPALAGPDERRDRFRAGAGR